MIYTDFLPSLAAGRALALPRLARNQRQIAVWFASELALLSVFSRIFLLE
jgi:hypothetical protein